MFKDKKIIAYIPARAGSKGIVRKNMRLIKGKPLFMHSVDYAFESAYIDDVLVSSDDPETLNLAHKRGCVINGLRPAELSGDRARIIDGVLYELSQLNQKYDAVVLLQPTFPIRPPAEVLDEMIEKYFETETSLITVVKCADRPEFFRKIGTDGFLYKIVGQTSDVRRQEAETYYRIIGSVYINNVHTINASVVLNENIVPFVLDRQYALDIDTEDDWKALENSAWNRE